MVLKQKKKKASSRNLLAYFIESKLWKKYQEEYTNNYAYWICEDPDRAARMYANVVLNRKGYMIKEYIWDMLECVFKSDLKWPTKDRLFDEIHELEQYHISNKTYEVIL